MKNFNLEKAIEVIQSKGYTVRSYANYYAGELSENMPVAYEIITSDYVTLYGYGTCSAEQIILFAEMLASTAIDNAVSKKETIVTVPTIYANHEKEREYDLAYNEGGEGFNPYRIGSAHTYRN